MWQVYLVLCSDNTLYCGISTDVDYRLKQHNAGKGAKYTRGRRPVCLVWCSPPMPTKAEATKEEIRIKKLKRLEKWEIIEKAR